MADAVEKLRAIQARKQEFLRGGGDEAIARQHQQGKLTARERVAALLDPGTFRELDMLLGAAADPFNPAAAARRPLWDPMRFFSTSGRRGSLARAPVIRLQCTST